MINFKKHFYPISVILSLILALPCLPLLLPPAYAGHTTSIWGVVKSKTPAEPVTGMEFTFIKGGCFEMGDLWKEGSKDELPVHVVCVDSFDMGTYEVSQGQWQKVMGHNPSKIPEGENHPVENVTWNEAQEFIVKLNSSADTTYRLPTEAEWEYAAKMSKKKIKYATATGEISHDLCNYDSKGGTDKWNRTSPVGSFPAAQSGLHDMCGNVWEWVEDSYDFHAYRKHARNNPLITNTSADRVIRGCGWSDDEEDCRVSYRDKIPLDCPVCSRRNDIGFRVVRER